MEEVIDLILIIIKELKSWKNKKLNSLEELFYVENISCLIIFLKAAANYHLFSELSNLFVYDTNNSDFTFILDFISQLIKQLTTISLSRIKTLNIQSIFTLF